MSDGGKKHRHFVFTLNNPTLDDPCSLDGSSLTSLRAVTGVSYLIIGLEKSSTGTPHFQGAISFSSPRSERSVRRALSGCHVEVQRGSHHQSHAYCRKEGNFQQWGNPTVDREKQAADQSLLWAETWELAKAGKIEEIDPDKRIKYYSTFKRIARDFQCPLLPLEGVCGVWIHGPSGSGKSHSVFTAFPNAYLKDTSKWFCGYQGEDTVWIDDVDPTQTSWIARFLKIWADRYPFPAQVKGGSMVIRPKRVIITSNYRIDEMGFSDPDLPAIMRRYVSHFKENRDSIIEI